MNKISKYCFQCKKEFYILPHLKDKRRFCSKQCYWISDERKDIMKKYRQDTPWPKGKPHPKASKRMKENNPMKLEKNRLKMKLNNPAKRPEVRKKISIGLIEAYRTGRKKILKGEQCYNFNNYSSLKGYTPEFNNILKKEVRERDNNTCFLCGIKQNETNRKLEIHHIDYVKKNNNKENLITLCKSCHMKTNGFVRSWWKLFFTESLKFQYIKNNL